MVIETGRGIAARAFFCAVADYPAIGFGPFGVDGAPGAGLRPDRAAIGADFRVVQSAIPVIAELQGTGKLKAAAQETGTAAHNLILSDFDVLVRFHPPTRQPAGSVGVAPAGTAGELSERVLIAELATDGFLIVGFDASVEFRPVQGFGLHSGPVALQRGRRLRKRCVEADRAGQHCAGRLFRPDGQTLRTRRHDTSQVDEVLKTHETKTEVLV